MKMVKAIIRTDFLEPLKDEVLQSDIGGMTVNMVHGCGNQNGWKEYFRGKEIIMNMVPKVECEFAVPDDKVDEVVELVTKVCRTGEVGDGKIFISSLEEVIRIRTGERGVEAL